MCNKVRFVVLGLLVAVGFALAPTAFARSHVNVGINLGFPGVSIGYSDCRHCGYGGGYYGYAPAYYGPAYAPAYYGPAYYSTAYYGPAYYSAPAYGAVYYSGRPAYYSGRHYDRGYDRGRGEHRGRDNGHRASYYDRGDHRR